MSLFSRVGSWLGRLVLGRPIAREFDEELRFHLDEQIDAGIQAGLTPEEARRAAHKDLGRPAGLIREECRDAWGQILIGDLSRDLTSGARQLRRAPVFTAVALATLTVAIGATVAVFSLVDAWLIRPLPFPRADRLVVGLAATAERPNDPAIFLLYRDFLAWQERARNFEHLAAAFRRSYLITNAGDASEAVGLVVSEHFFKCFDVRSQLGRFLSERDVGGPPRVVLGYGLWQRLFGGAPDVVGRSLALNGTSYEVIGVMPATFDVRLLDQTRGFELWTLLDPHDPAYARGTGPVAIFGRLRDNTTLAAAKSEVDTIQRETESGYTEGLARYVTLLTPLGVDNARTIRATVLTMAGAASGLLLIAALNIGTILIGRGMTRTREAALRVAVGCSRGRLIRQLLTETLLLCVCGSVGGLILAVVLLRLFVAANPLGALPPYALTINWRMLIMTAGAVGVITALAGLVPALRTSRCDLSTLVSTGDARSTGAANPRVQLALLGIQTAISLVLAATTVLLVRTFSELQRTPLGFNAANLVVVDVALPADRFDSGIKREAAFASIAGRLAALPGIQQIAASTSPPLASGSATSVRADVHDGDVPLRLSAQDVTPRFFQTLGIPLTAGRVFDEGDQRTSAPVAMINQSAARVLFDRIDVVGRHIRVATEQPREVVGVVGNTQSTFYNTLEWRTNPVIFLPASQAFDAIRDPSVRSFGLHLLLRTSQTISMTEVKPLVTAVDPNIAVSAVTTTSDQVADATKQPHFRMTLLAWFGGASLLLAAIGVYGVVAQVVVARRREFGVRLALGAATTRLVRSLVSRMLWLGMVSIACGGVLLIALRQTIRAMLYGVQPLDTRSIALATGLLLLVLTVAALIPALRLLARDPLDALRE